MVAVPNDPDDPLTLPPARKASAENITGTRSHSRGLRAIYFSLTASAYLVGLIALILATLSTLSVLLRREFLCHSHLFVLDQVQGRLQPDGKQKHQFHLIVQLVLRVNLGTFFTAGKRCPNKWKFILLETPNAGLDLSR